MEKSATIVTETTIANYDTVTDEDVITERIIESSFLAVYSLASVLLIVMSYKTFRVK